MKSETNNEINGTVKEEKKVNIIDTSTDKGNGQTKCASCGSTDISFSHKDGKLRCNYCSTKFEPVPLDNIENNIAALTGLHIGEGTQNINLDYDSMLTIKCTSCGAEVVIDTGAQTQSRCHWCRNTLSVNEKIPNGAVPDGVLPFSVQKEDAKLAITTFVAKRQFFAHPTFKKEFTTDNIMGVYFPYLVVDINASSRLAGEGEVLKRKYTVVVGSGDHKRTETRYDADVYKVDRNFDIAISNITVESNMDKLHQDSDTKTTNIINSIMPFDVENVVKWDANYIKGFTSEKRDVNYEELKELVTYQAKDVAQFKANETITKLNRGVRWDQNEMTIKGEQWLSAYLPVWLYSYQEVKGDKKILHYVAVNARTKETMGSVPINFVKLAIVSIFVEILSWFGMTVIDFEYDFLLLVSGPVYYYMIYSKYRNQGARHSHEKETESTMSNLTGSESFVKSLKGLSNARMNGANNLIVNKNSKASVHAAKIMASKTQENTQTKNEEN